MLTCTPTSRAAKSDVASLADVKLSATLVLASVKDVRSVNRKTEKDTNVIHLGKVQPKGIHH